ncbi:MAG: homocysteine S-methyltransferase family protein [Acidobacteriaceae bacterium]
MEEKSFLARIKDNELLVADGATGTTLINRGLPNGSTSENWVLEQPEQILQLHRDFISAGADIVLTSTFSATSIRMHGTRIEGMEDQVNRRAVELAREAGNGKLTYIAGSMGPVGQLLKPYGPLEIEAVRNAYAKQAESLSEAGADLLVVETQFDLGEVRAAVEGVRSISSLPLVVSLSYDRGRRTMMGVSPAQSAKELEALPVDLIGINCGRSLEENLQNLTELRENTSRPIWFKPNAGLPRVDKSGRTYYDTTPELMGSLVPSWLEAGAQVVGGCCGTSPDHLRQISARVKS